MTHAKQKQSSGSKRYLALEPRVLLDAAAVQTVAEAADLALDDAHIAQESLFVAPAASNARSELYVIDATVDNYQALLSHVPVGAELLIIQGNRSGLAQLNESLAISGKTFDAIHIISHGAEGVFALGSDSISMASLSTQSAAISQLGSFIAPGGDLLLYGCDIAAMPHGEELLSQLAALTGADVAASVDATGGPNGNLVLEAFAGAGAIDTDPWSALNVLDKPLALQGLAAGFEDGAGTSYNLGRSLDGDGEWVVAGGAGEVQVWRVLGNTRVEQVIVRPTGSTTDFGAAVSISGDTFVVGDRNAGTAGFIYIYRVNPDTKVWSLVQSLDINTLVGGMGARVGQDWSADNYQGNQWLSVSGSHIVVGAPTEGSNSGRIAWFADRSTNLDWSDTSVTGLARGVLDEPTVPGNGNTPQRFGASVSIAQDVLVVGAPTADMSDDGGLYGANNGDHGAVHVYNWSASSDAAPVLASTLSGLGAVADARFGAAVDVEYFKNPFNQADPFKYTIVVGAPAENGSRGEVYIYQTSGATFSMTGLSVGNIYGQTTGNAADRFGRSVAVSQGRVLVGAPNHDNAADKAVFYYEAPNNNWTSLNGLDTNNPAAFGISFISWSINQVAATSDGGSRFGLSVALSNGNNVAAGAPRFDQGFTDSGRVGFFYARTPVAVNDSWSISEDAGLTSFNPLANDILGTELNPTIEVNINAGKGILTWDSVDRVFRFNPNGEFEYLSVGESEQVTARYSLKVGNFFTTADITITVNGVNDAPVADSGLPTVTVPRRNEPPGNPAGPLTFSTGNITIPINTFFDVDQSDILTYSLVSVTPLGSSPAAPGGFITVTGNYNKVTGTNTGNIAYNLTGMTENTSYQITIRANDGNGGIATTSFVFNVARDNQNPETSGVPNQIAVEDAIFSQSLVSYFTDPDAPSGLYPESLSFTIVSQSGPGPDWLSISPSGQLAGAPANENVGVHSVTVRATDIFGNWIQSTFNVTVQNTNDAPVLVNPIDPKVSIKGETFSFNVLTGLVQWNGVSQPIDDAGPFFFDIDNSTADGRSPSSGDTITYTAFNAVTGEAINLASGGASNSFNDTSWLRFNGTTFTGTSAGVLGSTITVRLVATDNHGASTSTTFDIGIFPRDGGGAESGLPATPVYAAQLGYAVAVNAGTTATGQGVAGRWAVVGEPGSDNGNGRIRIYENTNFATVGGTPTWVERYTFTTAAAGAALGTAVDISDDGSRIVAGAPLENGGRGAVYYYSNNGSGVWAAHSTAKGTSPDADPNDRFGSAVAINENGGFVLVGAPFDDAAGTNAGAAYFFAWGSATGANKLLPTFDTGESGAARAGDLFGYSVAFDQNMLVVGAPRDDHSGKTDAGSVYVFSTDNTAQFAKLTKTTITVRSFDYFGESVSVDSFNTRNSVVVVVGTPGDDHLAENAGAVYVFRSDSMNTDNGNGGGLTSFSQQARITAYNGRALDGFGSAVSVDANELDGNALRIAVGSAQSGNLSGSVYAYRFWSGFGWLGQRFLPNTAATGFGAAVDIAGATVIVGAPDTERSGGAVAADDLGTRKPQAGKIFGFGLAATAPIEISPLSGSIVKVVGSGEPAPVILSNAGTGSGGGSGSGGSGTSWLGGMAQAENDDDWRRLMRPVSDWSLTDSSRVTVDVTAVPVTAAATPYSDAVLFDERTQLVSAEVLQAADAAAKQAEEGEGKSEVAPAANDAPQAFYVPGFTEQLHVTHSARAREVNTFLGKLASLAS